MTFASRKSRMRAPLHRRTETIGACIADPFANGEGAEEADTFTIPEEGAGGGCIDPGISLLQGDAACQPRSRRAVPASASGCEVARARRALDHRVRFVVELTSAIASRN